MIKYAYFNICMTGTYANCAGCIQHIALTDETVLTAPYKIYTSPIHHHIINNGLIYPGPCFLETTKLPETFAFLMLISSPEVGVTESISSVILFFLIIFKIIKTLITLIS